MGRFLKFFAHVQGASWYPITALMVFLIFFVAVTWYALRLRRSDVEGWSALPLESNDLTAADDHDRQ